MWEFSAYIVAGGSAPLIGCGSIPDIKKLAQYKIKKNK